MDGPLAWGWDARWSEAFARLGTPRLVPARVIARHRGRWLLGTADGELGATVSGRLRRASAADGLPAVGDWVGFARGTHDGDVAVDAVLPRRTTFRRRAPGSRARSQVVAVNIDTLLVVTGLDRDLNPRRLERYVAMARESGAEPVVMLTKTDLAGVAGLPRVTDRLRADLGVPVVAGSSLDGSALDAVAPWAVPGRTLGLVGSSGVGKSTLLNLLAGASLMDTRAVRADDSRGRHTTTHRELFRLRSGALLVDTPGMREVGMWEAGLGLDETFADVGRSAQRCRFGDCRHQGEPGCAVREAIARGALDEGRLRAYRRLVAENAERPAAHERRASERRFGRAVRLASEQALMRKSYRSSEG